MIVDDEKLYWAIYSAVHDAFTMGREYKQPAITGQIAGLGWSSQLETLIERAIKQCGESEIRTHEPELPTTSLAKKRE